MVGEYPVPCRLPVTPFVVLGTEGVRGSPFPCRLPDVPFVVPGTKRWQVARFPFYSWRTIRSAGY